MTKQEWNDIEMLQYMGYTMLCTLYIFGFYNIRGSYILLTLVHCVALSCFKIGGDMLNSVADIKIMIYSLYPLFLLPLFFVIMSNKWNQQTEIDYRKKALV